MAASTVPQLKHATWRIGDSVFAIHCSYSTAEASARPRWPSLPARSSNSASCICPERANASSRSSSASPDSNVVGLAVAVFIGGIRVRIQ